MGKTASKFTQALGFGGGNSTNGLSDEPSAPKPPQWDTTIDQLFGDAPADENVIETPPVLEPPRGRRRRPPPPPPSMFSRGRGKPFPSSPAGRRKRPRGTVRPMRTPIIPDMPRRVATRGVHALNGPFGVNRRPMVLPAPTNERELPGRVVLPNNFKRRPSHRRKRPSSQRNQRLQELLQCPVCLTPYIEPRLLPCGHTYCDECLNRLIQNDNDVVTCPECRKQHLVPDDGVFPSNFVVRNLLEEQGISPSSRVLTSNNLSINAATSAKCTICETFAPLRLCRHCNYMVCDRCFRGHRLASNDPQALLKRSKPSSKVIQFFVAVRKITRTDSQVKRLTIDMPIGNYLRDTCESLIRRIAEREQLQQNTAQLVLEFGDKRLRPQRTLASYGVQNGDLLFLFNPDQRLHFLSYDETDHSSIPPPIPQRFRSNSFNSSSNDIRTTTSTETNYNRAQQQQHQQRLSPISDQDDRTLSNFSDDDDDGYD